jgi:hypothetical protein
MLSFPTTTNPFDESRTTSMMDNRHEPKGNKVKNIFNYSTVTYSKSTAMEGDGCWSMITTAKITVKNDA